MRSLAPVLAVFILSSVASADDNRPKTEGVPGAVYTAFKAENHFNNPVMGTVTRVRGTEKKVFPSLNKVCERGDDQLKVGDVVLLSKGLHVFDYFFLPPKKSKAVCFGPYEGVITIKGEGKETILVEDSFLKRKGEPDYLSVKFQGVHLKNLVIVNAWIAEYQHFTNYTVFENVLFDGTLKIDPVPENERNCIQPCHTSMFSLFSQPRAIKDQPTNVRGGFLEIGSMEWDPTAKRFQAVDALVEDQPKLKALVTDLAKEKTKNLLIPAKLPKQIKAAQREAKASHPDDFFAKHLKFVESTADRGSVERSKRLLTEAMDRYLETLNTDQL
ncbi:MAG: hypothetical protein KF799_00495 [Bdellovibrionales bacterium]|nr:hypothetical protein [Bdellovibrionales bacterium]